ncbi:3-deoxy-7-phosphoheptulonate synthase [Streptomyces sp. MZ04]|uniref:3-deoxy-7-phosphoheptulonate synthase n=1 Tax=Streptomyces sp. MZ04 TaxID=2559236 RepID=UPI00107E723F|nr:3-deoxy-7-phosphoheptulonate synthase [Streptomyces sp. MZ04]TGB15113.1 3-deoxy-7-phosphoheptulonate synthase [Streptomyces sp. MZ04]
MLRHEALDPGTAFVDLHKSARLRALSRLPAAHQPKWLHHTDLACIRGELAALPALVGRAGIAALRDALCEVEEGTSLLLHVGECAELFTMAGQDQVERRLRLYRAMADRLAARTGSSVVLLARMAGQHAKPRSSPTEELPDGTVLPVYAGDAVNALESTEVGRRADPWRLLTSYDRSRDTLTALQELSAAGQRAFVSHEALLTDYEEPMTRGERELHSAGGHLVWIGERTRGATDWHIQWAASIANPVGVKLGPTARSQDVVRLVRTLNPRSQSGRLSLIARMGAAAAADRLASLAGAVRRSGVPVLWQCDPMHGNTRRAGGVKLRLLSDLRAEMTAFVRTLRAVGARPGGLHLEVTPEDVRECLEDEDSPGTVTSSAPCDPRLNTDQALELVDHFAYELTCSPQTGVHR